jgi:hypothetical protein
MGYGVILTAVLVLQQETSDQQGFHQSLYCSEGQKPDGVTPLLRIHGGPNKQ